MSRGSTLADTSSVITTFDGFGRLIGTENSGGVRTTTLYDAAGRVTYEGYPFVPSVGRGDIGTSIAYDVLGRVRRRTNPDNRVERQQHEAPCRWAAVYLARVDR